LEKLAEIAYHGEMSPSSPRKTAVAAEAWRAIFDFIVATAPERNRYIGESGLTPNDARALTSLDPRSGRTMGSLAEEWKCDASTATWIVDRLEAKGLVRRQAHPTDRRVKLVVLTPQGARLKAKNTERMYLPPRALLELDLDDLVSLRNAVSRLAKPSQPKSTA
jgi:DNA-binding MarR family transcriptional regulator